MPEAGMSVRTVGIAVVLGFPLAGPAAAQSPADKADELNEQGKELYRKGDKAGAADKFRQAIVLSPEARFYYNLCAMLDEMGRLNEALTACEAVAANGASQALIDKTQTRIEGIKQRLGARGDDGGGTPPDGDGGGGTPPDGGGGTPPDRGGGTPLDGGGVGPVGGGGGAHPPIYPPPNPNADLSAQADPHAYKWSLGGEIGVLSNVSIGDKD